MAWVESRWHVSSKGGKGWYIGASIYGEDISETQYRIHFEVYMYYGDYKWTNGSNNYLRFSVPGWSGGNTYDKAIGRVGNNTSYGANENYWTEYFTYTKGKDAYTKSFSVMAHVHAQAPDDIWTPSVDITIPARTLNKQGNPTLTAKQDSVNYKESVQLSWGRASNQGNANFDRFELWNGNTKIYSGAGLSKIVVPSDYTGAKGGDTTFTIKEIHEWYGTYPTTQSTKVIKVRSGAITVYDASGNKHTGLLTAYDSKGKAHSVLISGYDSKGNKKSVV